MELVLFAVNVMQLYHIFDLLLLLSISSSSFFILSKKKSGINKSMEGSIIPVCPSPMCSLNRSNTAGTNSSKILCLMFVYYVLCYIISVMTDFVDFREFLI